MGIADNRNSRQVCCRSNEEEMKTTMKLITIGIFLLGFAAQVNGDIRIQPKQNDPDQQSNKSSVNLEKMPLKGVSEYVMNKKIDSKVQKTLTTNYFEMQDLRKQSNYILPEITSEGIERELQMFVMGSVIIYALTYFITLFGAVFGLWTYTVAPTKSPVKPDWPSASPSVSSKPSVSFKPTLSKKPSSKPSSAPVTSI